MTDFAIPGLMTVPSMIVAEEPQGFGVYNPEPVLYGDAWPGIPGIKISVGGQPPPTNLLSVELSFHKKYLQPGNTPDTGVIYTSDAGGVQIIDPVLWWIAVAKRVLPLNIGTWSLRIRTNDAIEGPQTRVVGTMNILT